jgi:cyanophycinase
VAAALRRDDKIAAMRGWRLLLCAVLAACGHVGVQAGTGTVVAIGGALQEGNTEIWQRLATLVKQAPAGRDCWQVLAIASAEPDDAAARFARNLARHGGRSENLRVGPAYPGSDAADPAWADRLLRCDGVFMSGGAQARLIDTLRPGGRPTPLLQALQTALQRGGVVAGSSAGTAVLSDFMFRDAPDPLHVLKGRLRPGQEWDRGFALLPAGVVVDQHALKRGRLARLLPLLHHSKGSLGVAVEENSAAVFTAAGIEVLGGRGVLLVEPGLLTAHAGGAFGVQGATLHWLESGDRFDISSRRVTPSPQRAAGTRLAPLSPEHRGYRRGPWFYADVLGDGVIVTALQRLVDGDQHVLKGLAFAAEPAADDPDADLAFEWHFRLDAGTRAWLQTSPESYTVEGVKLDIVPARLQRPMWRVLTEPAAPASAPKR